MGKLGKGSAWRLALVVVAVIGLAGCAGPAASPSAQLTAVPSVQGMLTANPSPTPTPTLAPTSSPTARPPLKFVATGSMHVAREYATATLLPNGKVLITGGMADFGLTRDFYASAELYDPATGKFTKTGSMTVARTNHTATLLADGRVLIAGGYGCADPRQCSGVFVGDMKDLGSAELYDPKTGKFSSTGSVIGTFANGTGTLLADGRVLLAEGDGGPAELYDAQSGKFVATGKEIGFANATAALLPNGKVLLTGQSVTRSATTRFPLIGEIYDEASGKFTKVSFELPPGSTQSAQYNGQVVKPFSMTGPITVLKDGRILLFQGGYLETYDPAAGSCVAAGFVSPGAQWEIPTATLLSDGRVLILGGGVKPDSNPENNEVITNSAVLYDPSGGAHAIGSMKSARRYHTATLLSNGAVLIAGGQDAHGKPVASAELFKP